MHSSRLWICFTTFAFLASGPFATERDLSFVRAGLEADIHVASVANRQLRGVISRVSPVVDRLSRTATVRIMLDNPDHLLRPGSLAEVRLEVERHDEAVVVPQYALVLAQRESATDGQRFRAFLLDQGGQTVVERLVRTGIFQGDFVEVLEGIAPGDQLIVEGQHLLAPGSRVNVVRRRTPPAPAPVAEPASDGGGAAVPASGSTE